MDLETGSRQAGVGEPGEMVVSGPQVMKGHLNRRRRPHWRLRTYDGKVWLHTGDVARMDEDGFFFIVDRVKDMLNVAGTRSSPEGGRKALRAPRYRVLCDSWRCRIAAARFGTGEAGISGSAA